MAGMLKQILTYGDPLAGMLQPILSAANRGDPAASVAEQSEERAYASQLR